MEAVYLDYAATTPLREEVRAAMAPYADERFGNPSSLHRWGREAAAGLEQARADVAESIGARPGEIHFVRGGTESDNVAVLGACQALRTTDVPPTLVVSAVEHPAVFEAAEYAAETGLVDLHVFRVGPDGSVDLDALSAELQGGPSLVSAMWVNNETGMVLPIAEIAATVKAAGGLVHSDASQGVGKVPVSVTAVPVDLLTATGHKIHGPKGMGILFVREGVAVSPLLHGGGQERALRPGTEDVAGAVGFATALRLAVESQSAEADRLEGLRATLEASLQEALDGVRVNSGDAPRAPHVASIGFSDIPDGAALLMALDLEGLAVSGGSACASGSDKGSHVISALYGDTDDHATVRYSFGMRSSEEDVHKAVATTVQVVGRMRAS